MDNERTAVITIGDEEYTLLLTTKATNKLSPQAFLQNNYNVFWLALERCNITGKRWIF